MSFFTEGWAVMRERLSIYAFLGLLCAVAGAFGASGLEQAMQRPNPDRSATLAALFAVPGLRVVMLSALAALFFILPSALRRIQPDFRMTPARAGITLLMLFSVGFVTELGTVAFVAPGVVAGVLASQALFNSLLSERRETRGVWARVVDAFARSMRMTGGRFFSTLGVVALSMAILLAPFFAAFVAALVLIGWNSHSLIATSPLLFFTFVYFECVRYAMIVRWYEKLAR
jgi:uncharacterized membrane protein YgdD (TMEM256/DUF423 family)